MKHEIKIWPVHFERVLDGTKTFEIRNNDRAYQMGDTVVLKEWIESDRLGMPPAYSGREKHFKIGVVYPLDENMVVFALVNP
jgi:hypothetical protein